MAHRTAHGMAQNVNVPIRPIRDQEVIYEEIYAQNPKCLLNSMNIVISRISSIARDQKVRIVCQRAVKMKDSIRMNRIIQGKQD